MRIKSILTAGLALIAVTLAATPPTYADDFLWLGLNPSGGWTDQSNWLNLDDPFLGGYPNGSDDNAFITIPGRVEIRPVPATGGCTSPIIVCNLNVNNGDLRVPTCLTVGCKLTIKPNASLSINGGTLVLTGDDVNHEIGGDLNLTVASSTLRIEGDATFDPFTQGGQDPVYGNVKGQHNYAAIEICKGKALTNNITIHGQMTIQSATCETTAGGGPAGQQHRSSAQPSGPQQQ